MILSYWSGCFDWILQVLIRQYFNLLNGTICTNMVGNDWCITNLTHGWWVFIQSIVSITRKWNWSLNNPLWYQLAVILSDRRHQRIRNLYSTVPVDVVMVKSFMHSLFNPMRVPVKVSINKLNFHSFIHSFFICHIHKILQCEVRITRLKKK